MDKPEHLKLITTRFIPYRFPSDKHPDYQALLQERKDAGVRCMEMWGGSASENRDMGPERDVVINTEHVFGNQWNTQPDQYSDKGWRVFNWFLHYQEFQERRGHYLVITDEMREVCRLTYKCGYCGAAYWGEDMEGQFCHMCLGSEYLEQEKLYMLRLAPVGFDSSVRKYWPPLTEAEASFLIPLYIRRQTVTTEKKALAKRQRVLEKFEQESRSCLMERDGFLWLLDHGISTENVIYHATNGGVFCFGWLKPLSPAVRAELSVKLQGFPFTYKFEEGKR